MSRKNLAELYDKEYRDAYVETGVDIGLAFQVRALRLKRGWTQKELGKRAGLQQSAVSRVEGGNHRMSIETLLKLARAFDTALSVRFVSFGQFLLERRRLDPETLAVEGFEEEFPSPEEIHGRQGSS